MKQIKKKTHNKYSVPLKKAEQQENHLQGPDKEDRKQKLRQFSP